MIQRKFTFSKKEAIAYIMEISGRISEHIVKRLHELNILCYGSDLARPVCTYVFPTHKKFVMKLLFKKMPPFSSI